VDLLVILTATLSFHEPPTSFPSSPPTRTPHPHTLPPQEEALPLPGALQGQAAVHGVHSGPKAAATIVE
jgi:hypothetical protein